MKTFVMPDASVTGYGLVSGLRDDPRALKWYARMGLSGAPETIEQIHEMLDAEDAAERRA